MFSDREKEESKESGPSVSMKASLSLLPCSDRYELMLDCWSKDPQSRPSCEKVQDTLDELKTEHPEECICMFNNMDSIDNDYLVSTSKFQAMVNDYVVSFRLT